MPSHVIVHMRCPCPEDAAAMQRRYCLFKDMLCRRFEEPLAKWRRSAAKIKTELEMVLPRSGDWHHPLSVPGHLPFLSVKDNVYLVATMTPANVNRLAWSFNTEVVFLLFSSITENFQFTRSVMGVLQRHLFNKGDHGWQEVLGTPEPWEPQAFPLEQLDKVDEFYAEDPEADDIRDAVEKVRQARRVPRVGLPDTFLNDWEIVRIVEEHYGLPGWGDIRIWR